MHRLLIILFIFSGGLFTAQEEVIPSFSQLIQYRSISWNEREVEKYLQKM